MMTTTRTRLSAVVGGALLLATVGSASEWSQTTGTAPPPVVTSSMYGRDLFELYCSSCHGRDGRGAGPAAGALNVPPSDLTTLARRNGGNFPKAAVIAFVTVEQARLVPAHGSKEMPVWGPIFRGLDRNEAANRERIKNIVAYISSMQVK
jgi:mono/diheme cytochrome c family protein